MEKDWVIQQPEGHKIRHLCRRLGCHAATAATLVNRGIVSADQAEMFFSASLQHIHSFFSLKDMDQAVCRIADALFRNEKILVFGDYDVDGITSTTLMYTFIKAAGGDVMYHVPHRINEGYGLKPLHIPDVAVPNGIGLIITTDCGSSSHEAVDLAAESGIDVVVTDHHSMGESIPGAAAVVNPKRPDCHSGFDHLAGVGVAFYLLICLRKYLRDHHFWDRLPEPNLKTFCDLVALGTVADIVPLIAENRIITKTGLEVINTAPRPGIQALIEVCGIQKPFIDAEDLAFRLAPRLNAAGRMGHAGIGVQLLLTQDLSAAREMAETINAYNTERQGVERRILKQIQVYLEQEPALLKKNSIVLWDASWHQGVLGIVASRVAENFSRPVILLSINEGFAVGSARSIPGIDLYSALKKCASDLETFGGHHMAAGLKVRPEKLEQFVSNFESIVSESALSVSDRPRLLIDYVLDFNMISEKLTDELTTLAPFGADNPEPLFAAYDVTVEFSKVFGEKHRKMLLTQPASGTTKKIPAICFNMDPQRDTADRFDRIAFRLRWNHYNGKKTLQLVVEETQSTRQSI